jgi:hypothetical protein
MPESDPEYMERFLAAKARAGEANREFGLLSLKIKVSIAQLQGEVERLISQYHGTNAEVYKA